MYKAHNLELIYQEVYVFFVFFSKSKGQWHLDIAYVL